MKFTAVYPHEMTHSPTNPISPDEGVKEDDVSELRPTAAIDGKTRFLALDKCLQGRDFMQVVEMEVDASEVEDNRVLYGKVLSSSCIMILNGLRL